MKLHIGDIYRAMTGKGEAMTKPAFPPTPAIAEKMIGVPLLARKDRRRRVYTQSHDVHNIMEHKLLGRNTLGHISVLTSIGPLIQPTENLTISITGHTSLDLTLIRPE